jgi:hypothetical protein
MAAENPATRPEAGSSERLISSKITPRKLHTLTDEERAERIRETAEEIGTSNEPETFERAFGKIVPPKRLAETAQPETVEKRKAKKGG